MKHVLSVVAVAALLAGCNTSYNYFEDDRSELPERNEDTAFGILLGAAGIVSRKSPPIEYETRAPLAMPPSRELPAPEPREAAVAATDVDWPDDPDEAEAARRRANSERGEWQRAYDNSLSESQQARLSPEAVQEGRLPGGGQTRRADTFDSNRPQHFRLSPAELAKTFRGRSSSREILTETGEARPRQYLVEPPDTYRTPSESAPLPEPGDIENSDWVKKRVYGQQDRRPPRAVK